MPPPIHGAAMIGQYIHESKHIKTNFDCHYINLATSMDLRDIGKFKIRKLFTFIYMLLKIVYSIMTIRPQLIYITPNACGKAFYKDFIIVMLLKIFGFKIIVHYHNKGVATNQANIFDNLLYKMFFKNLKVILLTESLYTDINKYVSRDNVYICPNGIPEINNPLKDEHSNFNILFLSNMMCEKGVYILLEACKILKSKGLHFCCHFVGKWSNISNENFHKYVFDNNLSTCVTAYGAKYGEEKNKFMSNADVFVLPTYYQNECFPLVLLEAMQQKITCIASNEGGIPNIIDDCKTGFIISKKDPKELAQKIEYLYNHPDENKLMGENGYNKYCANYKLDIFERNFKDILINAISK